MSDAITTLMTDPDAFKDAIADIDFKALATALRESFIDRLDHAAMVPKVAAAVGRDPEDDAFLLALFGIVSLARQVTTAAGVADSVGLTLDDLTFPANDDPEVNA